MGNKGRGHPTPITQELVSLLNELDKVDGQTPKAKKYRLAEKLLKMALGYDYTAEKVLDDGTVVKYKVTVEPELNAIKEVFDRCEGKARQQVTVDTNVDVRFEDVTAAREKLGQLLDLKVLRQDGTGSPPPGDTGTNTGSPPRVEPPVTTGTDGP